MIKTIHNTSHVIPRLQALMARGTQWAPEGSDPATGCSCYGLIVYVYSLAGIQLPETPEAGEALFAIVPPPYQPWDVLLCNFSLAHGPRHLALLVEPSRGYHCSRATNGLARFTLHAPLWRRVLSHGLRYKEWMCI